LGVGGCSIGDEVAFFGFAFAVLASGGSAIPIGAADITVTPTLSSGPLNWGLKFESSGFSVTGDGSVSYDVSYKVDPHPILFGFRLQMDTSTPVAPGVATVTTALCVGAFLDPGCDPPGVPLTVTPFATTLNVSHNGITPNLLDSTSFGGAVAALEVHNTIALAANGASADINGVENVTVPEPVLFGLLAAGAIARVLVRRRRMLR
jgi:hypothetical protein